MNAVDHPLNAISVCSGIGGLDLAVERVLGARVVAYCEREAYAESVLLARMEEQALVPAPIYSDIRRLDGTRYRGLVDLVLGGIPCQPHSVAGKQRRGDDERDLIDEFVRLVREVEPSIVFVENVRGFVSAGGLGRLLGSLADLGLDAEWCCVKASDVGAPHRRERVFVLAYREHKGLSVIRQAFHDHGSDAFWNDADGCDAAVADAAAPRGGPWPPGPEGDWSSVPAWLWPALSQVEAPEPGLRGMADGLPELVELAMRYRVDRLRCLGNAVVPAQAEAALHHLIERLTD